MAFTHAQFIAYEVPTAAALPAGNFELDGVEICAAVEKDDVFQQAWAALSDDARSRLARVLTLIDMVRRNDAAQASKNTLKVFMAPEFYFRPKVGGTMRSYASADMVNIQALARMIFSQQLLGDWVCVLGSIVWNMKGSTVISGATSGSQDREKYLQALQVLANEDLVYNTTLIGIGGVGLQVYDKVHYSEFDQINRAHWPTIQEKKPVGPELKKQASRFDEVTKDEKLRKDLYDYFMRGGLRNTQCIINADNLHFGLEVCRDHACRLLARGYATFQQGFANLNDASPPRLDLQLLTACGMAVQPPAVVVGKNQYVFRLDGNTAPCELNGRFDHSEIQKVTAVDDGGKRTMLTSSSSLDDWTALNATDLDLTLSGDLAMDASGATGFKVQGGGDDIEFKEVPLDDVFKQRLLVYRQVALGRFNVN